MQKLLGVEVFKHGAVLPCFRPKQLLYAIPVPVVQLFVSAVAIARASLSRLKVLDFSSVGIVFELSGNSGPLGVVASPIEKAFPSKGFVVHDYHRREIVLQAWCL